MNKSIFTILLSLLLTAVGYGQQDPQYTQYMYNPSVVNPAYAGNRGVTSIVALHRSQWVGLDGAPRTQTLSVHSPMGSRDQVGLGLNVLNDEIGPTDETYINADFSYTFNIAETAKLSLGLKGGVHLLNIDYSRLAIFDAGDPRLTDNVDNLLSPQVGVGAWLHTDKFYLGVSSPNLLETDHFDENANTSSSYVSSERAHIFATTGYVFDLSQGVQFKPAVMAKVVSGAPLQLDITGTFLFAEKLHLGAAWRWDAALSGLVGFQISDQLFLGFAYDRETTELGNAIYNDGSFELIGRYELFKNYDRIITPRFF